MANNAIRNAAAEAGVRHWQIADAIGIAEETFSRKLRHELSVDEQQKILEIIEEIAKEAQL